MGVGMVCAPYLGMLVMERTGNALNVYKLRAASAAVQLAVLCLAIPETLEKSKVRPVSLASLNPFRFVAIVRAPRALQTLAATLFFNFFAEGKNIISLIQVWMVGSPLHWSVSVQARQSVVYGVFMFLSGKVVAPKLIRSLGEHPRACSSDTRLPTPRQCHTLACAGMNVSLLQVSEASQRSQTSAMQSALA